MDKYDEMAEKCNLPACMNPEHHIAGCSCLTEDLAAFGRECAEEARRDAFLEVVTYLSNFHQNRCHPEDGECACWTEHQQKHFQMLARASSSGKTGEREG